MFIGNEGLAPLVAVVTNRAAPTWVRQSAAYRIGTPVMQLGTNAVWAVTPLVGCLPDSNVSPAVAATLGRLELQPEIAVPALVKCLRAQDLATQSQAAWALGCFGAAAASAIHELRSASESRDLEVRKAATNALRQITTKLEAQGH
jgi:HEAT repeat protein